MNSKRLGFLRKPKLWTIDYGLLIFLPLRAFVSPCSLSKFLQLHCSFSNAYLFTPSFQQYRSYPFALKLRNTLSVADLSEAYRFVEG